MFFNVDQGHGTEDLSRKCNIIQPMYERKQSMNMLIILFILDFSDWPTF